MADPHPADPPLNRVDSSGEAVTGSPSTTDRGLQEIHKTVGAKETSGGDTPKTAQLDETQAHGLDNGLEQDGSIQGGDTNNVKEDARTVEDRLAAMEAQNKLVNDLFSLHGALKLSDQSKGWDPNTSLLKNMGHFLVRLDAYYEVMRPTTKDNDREDQPYYYTRNESESVKQISTQAFSRGEPAQISRMEWDSFVVRKGKLEDSILEPIDMVTSDPDATELMSFTARTVPTSKKTLPPGPWQSRETLSPGDWTHPERIRIHSGQIFDILRSELSISRRFQMAPIDSTIVIRRPFRELCHHREELSKHLARMEAHFENQGAISSSSGEGQHASPETGASPLTDAVVHRSEVADIGSGPMLNKHKQEDGHAAKDPHMSITGLLHLRCLMDFVDTELVPKADYIRSNECKGVLFNDLWHLYKPGDEVVEVSERQVYRVVEVHLPHHYVPADQKNNLVPGRDGNGRPHFTVVCVYIDFDGKKFGPVTEELKIMPFRGMRDIKTLPVYPLRLAKDPDARTNFIKRGRTLLDVSRFRSMYYNGLALVTEVVDGVSGQEKDKLAGQPHPSVLNTRDEIDSQVVVDFNEALADGKWPEPKIEPMRALSTVDEKLGSCQAACCSERAVSDGDYVDAKLTQNFIHGLLHRGPRPPSLILSPRPKTETTGGFNDPGDEELLVMTYRVFAFVLRSRKWAQLDLSFLRDENTEERKSTKGAFDSLELPRGHKDMIRSQVSQHFRDKAASSSDDQTDLIKGKGKGLILLLHGAPGVGKTTTAEGVAELFEKPLFHITCGDLGSTAKRVETELEKNFALASRWGCILLLDEADVFLCARDKRDFKRNGLVAVFLRILEYYTGVLFLTTNRLGDFDEAFASRIHISLYYPELDLDNTRKVFKLNLGLIKSRFIQNNRNIVFDEGAILEFSITHFEKYPYNRWNGRQIRNACQTALALAEYEAHGGMATTSPDGNPDVQLSLSHFVIVQKAYIDFGKYLGEIRNTPGDTRAYDQKLRARKDTVHDPGPSRFGRRQPRSGAGRSEYDDEEEYDQEEDHRRRPSNSKYQRHESDGGFQQIGGQATQPGSSANQGMYGHGPQQGNYMVNSPAFDNQQGFQGYPSQQHQMYPQGQPQMAYQQSQGANPTMGFNTNQGTQGQGQHGFVNGQQGYVPAQGQGQSGFANGQQNGGGYPPNQAQNQGQFFANGQHNAGGQGGGPAQGQMGAGGAGGQTGQAVPQLPVPQA